MGGGGGMRISVPPPQENYAAFRAGQIGDTLWTQTDPIRSSFLNDYYMPVLKGNYNPETLPAFAPQYDLLRGALEGQYNQAKQNVIASTPRGGAMTDALASLENERARNTGLGTSQLSSNIVNDIWNKGYNTGWITAPSQALTGLQILANDTRQSINSQLAAQMQAQQIEAQTNASGKLGGLGVLGSGIGGLLGMAAAPLTGGKSLIGTGLSGLMGLSSGLSSGKGAGQGVTSGLGGYSALKNQANPLLW